MNINTYQPSDVDVDIWVEEQTQALNLAGTQVIECTDLLQEQASSVVLTTEAFHAFCKGTGQAVVFLYRGRRSTRSAPHIIGRIDPPQRGRSADICASCGGFANSTTEMHPKPNAGLSSIRNRLTPPYTPLQCTYHVHVHIGVWKWQPQQRPTNGSSCR